MAVLGVVEVADQERATYSDVDITLKRHLLKQNCKTFTTNN